MVTQKAVRKPYSKKTRPRNPRVKMSETEKLLQLCQDKNYEGSISGDHMFEILENYVKYHVVSAEPFVLRELLRSTHKALPAGPPKSKIRGLLLYFTRVPIMVTWMKLSGILKVMADRKKVTTFVNERKEVPFDRIVDSTTLLTMATNPRYQERIELMDAKISRLKTTNPQKKCGAKNN